ncbi:hypothetical protein pb186bvf_011189 [Paramecium bursaria]
MLTELIIEICECERRTEYVRKLLSELQDFEPYTGIEIDKSRCGEISYQDVLEFMEENNCIVSSLEASYLLWYLDFNRDGRVTYTDFARQILPKSDIILKENAAARDSYFLLVNKQLPNEVEWALFKVLYQELANFRHLKSVKELCKESIQESYKQIDSLKLGFFGQNHLETFLKHNQVKFDKTDIQAFFNITDRDDDNRISICEFTNIMKPFHPSQILKDRERAFYSTPKKYRKLDQSPKPQQSQPRLAVNNSYQNIRQKNFVYKTPIKENSEMESQKQVLISQSDFNILDLFYQQPKANPQLGFKKFCKQLLPKYAPSNYRPKQVSSKTFNLMLNILRQ